MTNENKVPVENQKSIFVAIMGVPNAGKSTLTNTLVGSKVSIVTPKVQTTRTNIKGILMVEDTQIILIDTPGIFKPKEPLEKVIVKNAWQGVKDADMLALIVDVKKGLTPELEFLVKSLENDKREIILILNKIDKISRDLLLPLSKTLNNMLNFSRTFMISAINGDGIDGLKNYIASSAKIGIWHFNPDDITDIPARLWAAEIVREQLFFQLQQELPYQIAVETERFKKLRNGEIRIDLIIYVNKDSQKQIVLGKQGGRIKEIGIKVRRELEKSLEKKVQVFLFVKVKENWMLSEV